MTEADGHKKAFVEALRDRAEAMAAEFVAAAQRNEATELDSLLAENARLVIELAGEKESLLPRDELETRIEELEEWAAARGRALTEEVATLMAAGHGDPTMGAVEGATQRAAAEVDAKAAEFGTWVDEHAADAWIEALEKLATLTRGELPAEGTQTRQ